MKGCLIDQTTEAQLGKRITWIKLNDFRIEEVVSGAG